VGKRWKEKQRLEYILPRNMLNSLHGQTVYPYLRLLLPEQDSWRQFRVKEKKIAEMYCKAQGFGKATKNYEMLMVRPVDAGVVHVRIQGSSLHSFLFFNLHCGFLGYNDRTLPIPK
jgi:hypothetical protein